MSHPRGLQSVVCIGCGMVFRARAHQVECEEVKPDPRLVHVAKLLDTEYTDAQLKRLWKEANK